MCMFVHLFLWKGNNMSRYSFLWSLLVKIYVATGSSNLQKGACWKWLKKPPKCPQVESAPKAQSHFGNFNQKGLFLSPSPPPFLIILLYIPTHGGNKPTRRWERKMRRKGWKIVMSSTSPTSLPLPASEGAHMRLTWATGGEEIWH